MNLSELPNLVRLSNGETGVRATLITEAAIDLQEPVITFTASDATLDRYNEVIEPSGWQLANYQRNPVFQADHTNQIGSTIGRCERVWVENGKLKQTIRFAIGVNPLADMALALYRGGFLNAVSVGFIPRKWENGGETSGFRRRFIECELVELSAVAIPANPNALQDALAGSKISSLENVPPDNAPASVGVDTPAGLVTSLQTLLARMRGENNN